MALKKVMHLVWTKAEMLGTWMEYSKETMKVSLKVEM